MDAYFSNRLRPTVMSPYYFLHFFCFKKAYDDILKQRTKKPISRSVHMSLDLGYLSDYKAAGSALGYTPVSDSRRPF